MVFTHLMIVRLTGVELMGFEVSYHVTLVEIAVLVCNSLEIERHLYSAKVVLARWHCVLVVLDQLSKRRVICHRPKRRMIDVLLLGAIEYLEVFFVVRHLNFK